MVIDRRHRTRRSRWARAARAWVAWLDRHGDWNREHILDPAMLRRIEGRRMRAALDVGCGEGRFCRILARQNITAIGLDPTVTLVQEARRRDVSGAYVIGCAENLPFPAASFDLVISCLSLIAIADFRAAIGEMARVLEPGGTLLVANLTSFTSPCSDTGWVIGRNGDQRHYPVDRYLDEFPVPVSWGGIEVENWHRPLRSYMSALLEAGLELLSFDEPEPRGSAADAARIALYRRAPYFVVMEWRMPVRSS